MALIFSFLFEILQRPTIWDMVFELISFLTPIWVAIVIGVLVGWAWKPKWVNPNVVFESIVEKFWFLSSLKLQLPSSFSWIFQLGLGNEDSSLVTGSSSNNNSSYWMQNKFNGGEAHNKKIRPNSVPATYKVKNELPKEEFSDWPNGLLAIGTFGNANLNDNKDIQIEQTSEKEEQCTSPDLSEFTAEEVGNL